MIDLFGLAYHGYDALDVEDLTLEERYEKAIEARIDQFGGDHSPETVGFHVVFSTPGMVIA